MLLRRSLSRLLGNAVSRTVRHVTRMPIPTPLPILSEAEVKQQDQAFLDWCHQHGVLHPKIELRSEIEASGQVSRSLVLREKARRNEFLAAIPQNLILSRHHYPNRKLVALTDSLFPNSAPPLEPLTDEQMEQAADPLLLERAADLQLAIFLFIEACSSASKYGPWIELMPKKISNVAGLSIQEIEELFGMEHPDFRQVFDTASETQAFLYDLYKSHPVFSSMVQRLAQAKFGGEEFAAFEKFVWAFSVVQACAEGGIGDFAENDALRRQREANGEEIPAWLQARLHASLLPCIVPLKDMVRHADGDNQPNVELLFLDQPTTRFARLNLITKLAKLGLDTQQLQKASDAELCKYVALCATRDVDAGEVLMTEYADQTEVTPGQFLLSFGFLPKPLSPERVQQKAQAKIDAEEREEATRRLQERMSRKKSCSPQDEEE
eukprot:TRINITY_DN3616_c0_g1_i1.p1 TRINITY_DN3616_c0_g1~~TRINITY_DN3616_c0_g1_i1.p1  ORF type:complete len:437 (+),score=124.28 TRINITY_DN3616_c0_g1_i1:70-1380(+)